MIQQALKKERQVLEDAAARLLSFALGAGAESAEVCATYGSRTRINLERQDYHMASSDDGFQLGLRVLSKQRQGFASCNTTDLKELKEVALRAVEIAGFSPQNPYYVIGASENVPKEAPAELWDDALHQLSVQSQKEWTRMMVDEVTRDARFRLNEGTVSIASSLFLILNSLGAHKWQRETVAAWSLMGMSIEGEIITSFDYFQRMARRAAGVPEAIVASARTFRERLARNLKQGPAKSYRGLVVFSPRAVIDILLSPLCYHLNGRNVAEKTAKWSPGDMNQKILDERLTVRDTPWATDRMGCSIFDREGTPTRDFLPVEQGTLRGFFMDGYAAKALGGHSTGHAVGGPTSPPAVGPHCLSIEKGDEPLAALLGRARQQQGDFLVVHRYSGQVDPVTGDFSGVVKGSEWWHGGEYAYCIKETLISGNIFEALSKSVFGISSETEVVDSSEESPTLVVDNVSVTAG